jgi:GTP-binding protein LepA
VAAIRWFATAEDDRTDPPRNFCIQDNIHVLKDIPLEDVRCFCFVAHVDHGKSSLSSRILELTGNLGRDQQVAAWEAAMSGITVQEAAKDLGKAAPLASSRERIELLDTLAVEQQRGITVKASTATMLYPHHSAVGPSGLLLLNLYDTPGHADFGLEVTRSLSFVQGAVLLTDSTQGIQAQTWSVYEKAKSLPNPPELLIALTKVDLDAARPVNVALSVSDWLDWDDPDAIIHTSARNRIGIKTLLDAICQSVPPPKRLPDDDGSMLRVQVVDSWYDSRGVNCLVQVLSGELREGDRISIATSRSAPVGSAQVQSYSVQEVGIVLPHSLRTHSLRIG